MATDDHPGPLLAADSAGCEVFEEKIPSCDDCGACCREAFDSVPVEPPDLERLGHDHPAVRRHDDGWVDLHRVPSPSGCGTRCVALYGGDATGPFRCHIYERRPETCRDVAIGSTACLQARRRVGLSPFPQGVRPDGHWAEAGLLGEAPALVAPPGR